MKVTKIPRAKIRRYKDNPRRNESALKPVRKSILEFGFVQPIVVDTEFTIIIGHTRFDASEDLPEYANKVPCVQVDLPPEKVRALRIADNSTHEFATWDHEKLMAELAGIAATDFGKEMQDFFNGFNVSEELAKMDGTAPPEPAGTSKQVTFNCKPHYRVMVICENDKEQEKVYNDLRGRGLNCKVVTT
jgi:hypothetical protein